MCEHPEGPTISDDELTAAGFWPMCKSYEEIGGGGDMSNVMHFVTMLAYLTFAAMGAYLALTERLRLSRFFIIASVLLFVV
jgi:hypothetical protein